VVNDSILVTLIDSDIVQRLKHVRQAGAKFLVNTNRNGTRYEHSEGVMLLIRRIGGNLEEQIAGLLHDISHTAFSHTVDMLLNIRNENYHELVKNQIIDRFNIRKYFSGTSYDVDYILNEENFQILEQPQPNLCADRIDYTIRDLKKLDRINQSEIENFLNSLIIYENQIGISCIEQAEWFCIQFHNLVKDVYMDPTENYYSYKFTRILNYALEINCISMDDIIFGTDDKLLEIVYSNKDSELKELLFAFENKSKAIIDKNNYDVVIKPKARVIDPLLVLNNQTSRLSEHSSVVTELSAQIEQIANEGLFLRV